MNEYLLVYIKEEEKYNDYGYVISKIPNIFNEVVSGNNKKEIYDKYNWQYKILNILELD